MAKKKHHNRHNSSSGGGGSGNDGSHDISLTTSGSNAGDAAVPQQQKRQNKKNNFNVRNVWTILEEWFRREQQGIVWVVGCVTLGCIFGFGIGSGWLTGGIHLGSTATNHKVAPWRIELGARIRSSLWYQGLFLPSKQELSSPSSSPSSSSLRGLLFSPFSLIPSPKALFFGSGNSGSSDFDDYNNSVGQENGPLHPSHPKIFAVLREAIVREKNGYVHPDLGVMMPAPCGASRGVGMIRNSYQNCQSKCFPGVAKEKVDLRRNQQQKLLRNPENTTLWLPPIPDKPVYKQEEVLIRVPLNFQMTRKVALDTILPRIPAEVQKRASLHELDDAVLLVLLLAHERGVGRHSRWLPYLASLPWEPSCGYSPKLRPYILNSMQALQEELGVDTYGWKGELMKAHKQASKIVNGLARDYGQHIKTPEGMKTVENLEWALCQVASRATAGSEQFGALRMVPMMDMINHDAGAGAFVELTGKEKLGTYMTY